MITNETRLNVIADKNSSEGILLDNVQQLQLLSESRDFWANIVGDKTYSAAHRRIAFLQYFIRHSFYTKAMDLRLNSLNLLPSEWYMKLVRMSTGVPILCSPPGDAHVRIACRFAGKNWSAVDLSIFPWTNDADLIETISGKRADSSFVIMDVAASESLTSGVSIHWNRWQRTQVYKYHGVADKVRETWKPKDAG